MRVYQWCCIIPTGKGHRDFRIRAWPYCPEPRCNHLDVSFLPWNECSKVDHGACFWQGQFPPCLKIQQMGVFVLQNLCCFWSKCQVTSVFFIGGASQKIHCSHSRGINSCEVGPMLLQHFLAQSMQDSSPASASTWKSSCFGEFLFLGVCLSKIITSSDI